MQTINSPSEIPLDPAGMRRQIGEDGPTPAIKILGATAFDDLFVSDESIEIFII